MSAATLTASDRAAQVVEYVEHYAQLAAATIGLPDYFGDARDEEQLRVHDIEPEVFDSIKCVGREGWSHGRSGEHEWLNHEVGRLCVTLFRAEGA